LKVGENTVAILVWYFGKKDSVITVLDKQDSYLIYLPQAETIGLAMLLGFVKFILPLAKHKRLFPNYRLAESNIHFNAQNDIEGWFEPKFDDSRWESATELGASR
jgi:hypothetical protein